MSLINDALKRARETQRTSSPPGASTLPPVETHGRGGGVWILVVSAILFLAAAGFVLAPALSGHKASMSLAAKTPGVSTPSSVATATTSATVVAPAAPSVNPSPATTTNTTAAAVTNPPPPVVVVEKWPRVQGIIFNSTQPLAIVNGQSVNVGDRVGNFQVKQIAQTSVVFQRADGTQKTLGIGD